MKRTIGIETDNKESSTETESIIAITPCGITDYEIENSLSLSVTSEKVARQIRAVIDPLTLQLAPLCELLSELKNEQANRRHERTASFRAAS